MALLARVEEEYNYPESEETLDQFFSGYAQALRQLAEEYVIDVLGEIVLHPQTSADRETLDIAGGELLLETFFKGLINSPDQPLSEALIVETALHKEAMREAIDRRFPSDEKREAELARMIAALRTPQIKYRRF